MGEFGKIHTEPRPKTCHCITCDKPLHPMGVARHRAMHRHKLETCQMQMSNGDVFEYRYKRLAKEPS